MISLQKKGGEEKIYLVSRNHETGNTGWSEQKILLSWFFGGDISAACISIQEVFPCQEEEEMRISDMIFSTSFLISSLDVYSAHLK